MSRKHNPWVALVALLLLAVILVMTCTGCGSEAPAQEETPDRFVVDAAELTDGVIIRIITDTETGVRYLLVGSGAGYGVTVLQGGETTP